VQREEAVRSELSPIDVMPTLDAVLRGPNGIAASLLLNGVAPLVAYQLLTHRGVPSVPALASTAVFPVLGLAIQAARTRRVDAIAILSLSLIAVGVAGSLITNDPRFYLVRVSLGTAVFGLICLGSLLLGRPLFFYLGRTVVAGDVRRSAYYDGLWAFAGFRRLHRVLTVSWGVVYLVEAAVRVAIAFSLPVSLVLVIEPVLSTGVVLVMATWTIRYMGSSARAAAAAVTAPESAPG